MSDGDKPRRFARAVAVLRTAAVEATEEAARVETARGALETIATECEAAADLLEAAESEGE